MIKSLNTKILVAFMLGISFLSLQASSTAVVTDTQDDTVIITVDSTNLRFSPSEVVINEGQTVRFFWSGEFLDHNAVASSGIFTTGSPQTEMDYAFTFDKGTNDTYDFICEPHETLNMIGRIIVNPSEDNTDTNGTDTNGTNTNDTSGTADNNSVNSSSSLNGVAVVPAFLVMALVSRYLR
jgi:plastocyanin|tara:strand:+ start:153 stop:695 length:543 start_codon:yes stop_codon:yes gene_type:complete